MRVIYGGEITDDEINAGRKKMKKKNILSKYILYLKERETHVIFGITDTTRRTIVLTGFLIVFEITMTKKFFNNGLTITYQDTDKRMFHLKVLD